MFILSKLVWFVVQPALVALLLLAVSLSRMRRGRGRRTGLLAFIILAAAVAGPPGEALIRPLETRFDRPALPEKVDGIIVLSGGEDQWVANPQGRLELNSAGDRIVEFVRLANRYPDARLVHTGGRGDILLGGTATDGTLREAFEEMGIDMARVTMETAARNTHENVIRSKALVRPQAGETWIVITSAFHIPRSMGLFRKHDWDVIPWPTDFRTAGPLAWERTGYDTPAALETTSFALREWVGLAFYYALGRTDTLFPAPER